MSTNLKLESNTQTSAELMKKYSPPRRSLQHRLKSKSTQFISGAQRFKYEYSKNPGPGKYEQEVKERHTSDYHIIREEGNRIENREHLWIVSRGRQLFDTLNQWKANIGPGKYHKNKMHRKQGNSGWTKNARFNYEKAEQKNDVGPGRYALGNNLLCKKSVASSAFNSKSTKSHIEELVKDKMKLYESKQNEDHQLNELIDDARNIEEEEKKEEIKDSPSKGRGSPIFMSKLDRLPKISSEKVGPGSYNLDSPEKKDKRSRVKTDIRVAHSRQMIAKNHSSSKVIPPGPGAYDLDKDPNQSPTVKKPGLGIFLKESRFKSSSLAQRCMTQEGRETTLYNKQKFNTGSSPSHHEYELKNIRSILKKMQKIKERHNKQESGEKQ